MTLDSRESSVVCSLRELMAIEEQRVAHEATARAAERARRYAVEAAQRAVEDAQRDAEEEARRIRELEEEQRRRAEAARIEGLRQAELERVRLEAQRAAHVEELARHQEHERRLLALRLGHSARRLRSALIASAAFVLCLLLAFVFVNRYAQARDAELELLRVELRDKEQALSQSNAPPETTPPQREERRKVPTSSDEGDGTSDPRVEARQPSPQKRDALRRRPPPASPPTRRSREAAPLPICAHGDPLCGHL